MLGGEFLPLLTPIDAYFSFSVQLPSPDPHRGNPDNFAHALCGCVKLRMSQQAAHENRDLVLSHIQMDQTVFRVTQGTPIEVGVEGEKRDALELKKKRNDLFVFQSLAANIESDLTNRSPPTQEQLALALKDVFIQDVHTVARLRTYSGAAYSCECSRNAWLASRTASAMASLEIPPRHSWMIVSHAVPSATCSNTCDTRIRVPRNVGFPWQISGSVTTYRPINLGTDFLFFLFTVLDSILRLLIAEDSVKGILSEVSPEVKAPRSRPWELDIVNTLPYRRSPDTPCNLHLSAPWPRSPKMPFSTPSGG